VQTARARHDGVDISRYRQAFEATPDRQERVRVAVCICTRDRSDGFLRCAKSVLKQQLPPDCTMTLVVVDNSRDGSEREIVQDLACRGTRALYVHEPAPGIPNARNAAVEAALAIGATHIAFIDDDEIAPEQWLSRLLAVADETACDVVHGASERCTRGDGVRLASAWRASEARPTAEPATKAATNNVLFRSWIVAGSDGLRFDTNMHYGGSDGEFFMRTHRLGAVIMKTADAPVFEEWDELREGPAYQRKRAFRNGANCNYRYRKDRSAALAVGLISARAAERIARGFAKVPVALCLLPLDLARAREVVHKSSRDLAFAWGCFAPYVGMEPKTYY
jgi:succinoglycan biosynthesis protein ExoM